MTEPSIVPDNALAGISVGLSVSQSSDLERLGFTDRHAEFVVGELARAVIIAGGHLIYGGRIHPSGFTQFLMHEVHRYGGEDALTLCLAYPEHRKLPLSQLDELDRSLGNLGRLRCLNQSGSEVDPSRERGEAPQTVEEEDRLAESYSSLRRFMVLLSHARVLVGGQLEGYKGAMPGVVEEALLAVRSRQPLYVAGGFGGAALAVARELGTGDFAWLPSDIPQTSNDDRRLADALEQLREQAAIDQSWNENGLSSEENAQLAASHRPSEIAALIVLGLSRRFR